MPLRHPLLVGAPGVVRDPPPAPRDEDRLAPGRDVGEPAVAPGEPPAAGRREESEVVEEAQSEPAEDDRPPRRDGRGVDVRRIGRREVGEAVQRGEGGQRVAGARLAREVPQGQDDAVGPVAPPAARGQLPPARRPAHAGDPLGAQLDVDLSGGAGEDPIETPQQVVTVQGTAGIVVGAEHRHLGAQRDVVDVRGEALDQPLVHAGPRAHGALTVDGVVGEHRGLRGHGVHEQLVRLVRTPDPSRAGSRVVEHGDRDPRLTGRQRVLHGSLQGGQAPGPRTDDRDPSSHESPSRSLVGYLWPVIPAA